MRISYKRWNEEGEIENGQISFEYGNGQTKREEHYENGKLIMEKRYNEYGEIISEECWDEQGNVIECK